MGRRKFLIRDTGVTILKRDYYALGAEVSASIRDLLVKEYHAILAGDREKLRDEIKRVHVIVGMTDESDEALREIKRFYGFNLGSDAIRLAIRNGLKDSRARDEEKQR